LSLTTMARPSQSRPSFWRPSRPSFSRFKLIVALSRDATARRRARHARGLGDERWWRKDVQRCGREMEGLLHMGFGQWEMTTRRSGCCKSGQQAVSQNWNPLRDHYFNNDIFVQYLHAMLKKREAKSILAGSEMCHIFSPLIDSRVVCKVLTLPTICVFICMLVSQSNAEIPILKFQFSCRSRIRVMWIRIHYAMSSEQIRKTDLKHLWKKRCLFFFLQGLHHWTCWNSRLDVDHR
jgi:hypothetical protein